MKLTKRYLREVHSGLQSTADTLREMGLHWLAVALTPMKVPENESDLATLRGRTNAVLALLKLNPPDDKAKIEPALDSLKALLNLKE